MAIGYVRSRPPLVAATLSAILAVVIGCGAAGCASSAGGNRTVPEATRSSSAPSAEPRWSFLGAYTGPGAKGVDRLRSWEAWSGVRTGIALDFAPADSWSGIEGGDWQLAPWAASGRRLIYSVPLFPKRQGSLAECAAGYYDLHWTTLAGNLIGHRLPDTVVRPGWEFNGDWYGWASAGREADYAGCFRHLVDAMRAVPGQQFQFLWNPILGTEHSDAEPAYPGDAYVDYIGVDVYDMSWLPHTYPLPDDASVERLAAARRSVWNTILDGSSGLRFWARYAADHGKRLAVPEWGLSERTDRHGGGDSPYFVERMLAFLADPATRPSFAMYFEADLLLDDAGLNLHRISCASSVFPQAAARFREILASLPSAGSTNVDFQCDSGS